MSIKSLISDGKGSGRKAEVTKEHAVLVSDLKLPPDNTEIPIRPFRQYLTDDGLPNDGVNFDMQVNASAASPVDYFITSAEDGDRYLDSISIIIADGGAALNEFGAISALSEGVEIFYEDAQLGNVVIADSLKSNFEFLRLCGKGVPGIGATTNSARYSNVEGASEGYVMTLDFSEQFGMPWGIRIPKDSSLRFVVRIKDNTTGVDAFNMIAYGFDRIIND
jgi:hypothetical protein